MTTAQTLSRRVGLAAASFVFGLCPLGAVASESAPPVMEVAADTASLPSTDIPCEAQPYSILITVTDVKESVGLITVDLHGDNPKTFLKGSAKLARVRVPAVADETNICIPVDKPGDYAFALYHDKDSNHKLKKTWIGLPDEPFGLSNNPPLRMAMPKYKESAFTVNAALTPITVKLHE